ncbi:helix-turn-helix transcriptional regulator [Bacillus badius]|uniref:helix-turn-helix domain-containing protein n=1 Tax=Bacillus badius TaxID=1455 RepID=UPI001CC14C23|nr:helix-turn-helix transcriptional regulator [Bacillus badius]UAT31464.1 helix-turn-helix transcriptional regulator [Bacillus badius]
MPLKSNLRVIMAEKMIDNLSDLIELTGVSRNSLNKLWKNSELDTIKLGTLVKICEALKISLFDLIEYIPDHTE